MRRYTGRPTSSRVATIARKSFPLAHASTRAHDSSGTAVFTLVSVPVALRDDEAGGVLARCEEGGSPGGSSNERCEGRGVSCIPSCSSSESRGTSASGGCRADCARACCGQRWCRLRWSLRRSVWVVVVVVVVVEAAAAGAAGCGGRL